MLLRANSLMWWGKMYNMKIRRGTAAAVGFLVLLLAILAAAGFAGYYFAQSNTKEAILITVGVLFVIFVMIFAYFAGDHKKIMK
ncbi:hypothetical protein [Sulfolobus super-elliptical virus]|nr:hypothetical protein [Sulfolobus super-elliptical virus]